MESQHFVGEIAQKAIIEKDKKVLVSRHPADTKWDIPGGRIHTGEQPNEGLAREIREELGAEVEVGAPFFAEMSIPDRGNNRYFIAFTSTLKTPKAPFVFQKEEVAEVKWVGEEEVNSLEIFEVCRRALRAYFARQRK